MKTKSLIILTLMVLSLIATSCRSHRQLIRDKRVADTVMQPSTKPTPSVPTLPNQDPTTKPTSNPTTQPAVKTPKYKYQTLSANMVVTVSDYNVNAQLRMLNDSIIWITISKFIELARGYITPDSVMAYIKPTNDYIRCSMADFQRQYNIDIDFATVHDILLGQAVKTKVITSTPTNPATIGELHYAKNIKAVVKHPRLSGTVQVKYSSIELNKVLAFPFSIPKSASPLK